MWSIAFYTSRFPNTKKGNSNLIVIFLQKLSLSQLSLYYFNKKTIVTIVLKHPTKKADGSKIHRPFWDQRHSKARRKNGRGGKQLYKNKDVYKNNCLYLIQSVTNPLVKFSHSSNKVSKFIIVQKHIATCISFVFTMTVYPRKFAFSRLSSFTTSWPLIISIHL